MLTKSIVLAKHFGKYKDFDCTIKVMAIQIYTEVFPDAYLDFKYSNAN
jgi:hypothetical protein